MCKFSIIIPIYNVEKYLKNCIESILQQDFDDYEILLINDGSTDNSLSICKEYQNSDKRIKTISKENAGVSSARNLGISNAVGEFIIFLDADDTLTKNVLRKIDNIIYKNLNLDLIITDYNLNKDNVIHETKNEIFNKDIRFESGEKAIETIRNNNYELPKSVWRCVFKSTTVKNNQITFNLDYSCAEDFDFVLKMILISKNIYYSKLKLINYLIIRRDSATYKIKYKNVISEMRVFSKYYYYFKEKNFSYNVYSYFANNYANSIYTICELNNKIEINEVINDVNNNKIILKDLKGNKYIVSKLVWKIFGYYTGSKILRVINKIRKK